MATESGEMKLLGNFSKLIEVVANDPAYKPANAALKLPALNAQKAAALAAVQDVGAQEAPLKAAINDRLELFTRLQPTVSRVNNMAKASGAGKNTQDNLKTAARKLSGRRKTVAVKDNPSTPANEADKSHSASQMSYESQAGNFADFIEILKTIPGYAPVEPELKITGLTALANDLQAKNEAVNAAFAPVSAARGLRDELLYLNEDCVVNIALQVKAYVRAAFGASSQIYKSIKGLQFRRRGE